MIHDVDESLRALVRRDVLNEAGIEISFDAPTREWSTRRNAPALNLYLYEIREDLTRRGEQFEERRDERGFVIGRRPPPRKFKLSYLITAWTQRAEDEHRLLSAVLSCFLGFDAIPMEVLQGDLAEQAEPVRVTIALPLAPDRSITDVWTALGGELKPSLDLIVTCPFDTGRRRWVGPPVLEEPRIGLGGMVDGSQDAGGNGDGKEGGAKKGKARRKPGGKPHAEGDAAEAVVADFIGALGPSAGEEGESKDKRHGASSEAPGEGERTREGAAGEGERAGEGTAREGERTGGATAGEGKRTREETAAEGERTREGTAREGGPKPTALETVKGGRGPAGRKFRIQELPRQ
jgi:hypothetical protein